MFIAVQAAYDSQLHEVMAQDGIALKEFRLRLGYVLYLLGIHLVQCRKIVEKFQQGESAVVIVGALLAVYHDGEQSAEIQIVVRLDVILLQGSLGIDDAHQFRHIYLVHHHGIRQLVFLGLRVIHLVVGIAEHQVVEGFAQTESAFWRFPQEGTVQIVARSLGNVIHFHYHASLQVVYRHAWRRSYGN